MNRYFIISILISLAVTVGVFKSANGLKWVRVTENGELPQNTIFVDEAKSKWVGRARNWRLEYYPAQIDRNGVAHYRQGVYEYFNPKSVTNGEILTTSKSDNCQWKPYNESSYENIDQNAVRVDTASTGDLVFIGRTYVLDKEKNISTIYLPKINYTERFGRVNLEDRPYERMEYLSCDPNYKWVNYTINYFPPSAVRGGKSKDGYDIYVARRKLADGNFITGHVVPDKRTSVFGDLPSKKSDEIQILTGQPNEYEWFKLGDYRKIQDYAVVNGKRDSEPAYVALVDQSVVNVTQTESTPYIYFIRVLIRHDIEV